MGGLFGVVSKDTCVNDLFYGVDYHSHLGTTLGGLVVLSDRMNEPICHSIVNSQFKTEFKQDYDKLSGRLGIGVISSKEKDRQPIVFRSKHGTFALCTDSSINNTESLVTELIEEGVSFKDSTNGFNQTELVGELICRGNSITEGIFQMYEKIQGTVSLLLLSEEEQCIYASGGVFPLVVGKKKISKGNAWAVASETTAFPNLNYTVHSYPRYRDVFSIDETGINIRKESQERILFCPFVHVYFDFPASDHYGINGEIVRERCGAFLAEDDDVKIDMAMGVADSGIPHAHGYVKRRMELSAGKIKEALRRFEDGAVDSKRLRDEVISAVELLVPLRRPVIKFTAGWGRSYIPSQQSTRNLIAFYKQVSNPQMIPNQSIALVDDSIRRGTQLRRFLKEKIWPYEPQEVHARIASPPQLFTCYFDDFPEDSGLIARKAIEKIEGGNSEDLSEYQDVGSPKYEEMVSIINEFIGATSLKYISLSNMVKAIIEAPTNRMLKKDNLCTYCWTGKGPF